MPNCAVKTCKSWNMKKDNKNLKFFTFPKDLEICDLWMRACGKGKFNTKSSRICSLHFTDDDWRLKDRLLNVPLKKRFLNPSAVPSKSLPGKNIINLNDFRQKRLDRRLSKIICEQSITEYNDISKQEISKLMKDDSHGLLDEHFRNKMVDVQTESSNKTLKSGNATICSEHFSKSSSQLHCQLDNLPTAITTTKDNADPTENLSSRDAERSSMNERTSKEMESFSNEYFEEEILAKMVKLCRGCLAESPLESMQALFSSDDKSSSHSYNEMVTSCTGICIKEDDGLPQCLCVECANEVLKMYEFKNKCLRIDTNLRKLLRDCNANSLDELNALVLYREKSKGNVTNSNEKVVKRNVSTSKGRFISKKRKSLRNTKNTLNETSQVGKPSLATRGDGPNNHSDDSMNNSLSDLDPSQFVSKKTKRLPAPNPFPCRKCELHFLSWQELYYHNNQHPPITREEKLLCRYCKKTFCHERHIPPHFKAAHKEIPRFRCGYCGEKWKDFKYLKDHLTIHSPGDPVIDIFNEENDIYNSQCDAENEELLIDIKIPPLTDHFKTEESYPRIIDTEVELDTEVCGETESNIAAHNQRLNDTLICYTCKQLFIDKETLEDHLAQDHGSEDINSRNIRPSEEIPNTSGSIDVDNGKSISIKVEYNDAVAIGVSNDIDTPANDNDIGLPVDGTPIKKENALKTPEPVDAFKPTKKTKRNNSKTNLIHSEGDEKSRHSCKMCGKDFKSLSDLNRHEASHDPDKPFHCKIGRCKWSFATEYDLEVHVYVNHRETGDHECSFCHKVFPHRRNLRQHMLQHRSTKRFTCTYCSKGFTHMHHFKNHVRLHTKELPFLCQECGTAFPTKDRLKSHSHRHTNVRPFSCEQCDKTFFTVSQLNTHTLRHSGERLHMCSTCGKTFTLRSQLNNHARLVHTKLKDSQGRASSPVDLAAECKICGDVMSVGELNHHMKIHTCQYFCTLCPKSFPLTSALDAHIKTHSMGNRSHICGKCGAGFNRASHLRGHTGRCYGDGATLSCPHCSNKFASKPDLKAHIRTHTGERPYVCKECNRGFNQSHTLRIHMRTHTGEQPYICGSCHKGHRSASALAFHMRTHSAILKGKQTKKMKSEPVKPSGKTPKNPANSVIEDHPTMMSSLIKNSNSPLLDQQHSYTAVDSTSTYTDDVTSCIGKNIHLEEVGVGSHEIIISHKEEIVYD